LVTAASYSHCQATLAEAYEVSALKAFKKASASVANEAHIKIQNRWQLLNMSVIMLWPETPASRILVPVL
jgi:hypothetical protein